MARTFLIGIAAAVIAGIGLMVGSALGIEFTNLMMGVGGGLVLGMVRIGNPLERLGGYGIGMVLGVLFAALRLGLLPGGATVLGAAIAVAIVLIVITLVSGLTRNHISSWSMLLGALVFVSGFLAADSGGVGVASPEVLPYFLSTLAASAIGFLIVIVVEAFPDKEARPAYGHHFDEDHPKRDRHAAATANEAPAQTENQPNEVTTDLQGIVGDNK